MRMGLRRHRQSKLFNMVMVEQGILRAFNILLWELKLRYLPESQDINF